MQNVQQTCDYGDEAREMLSLSKGDLCKKIESALGIAVDVFRTGLVDCEAGILLSHYLETVTVEEVRAAAVKRLTQPANRK